MSKSEMDMIRRDLRKMAIEKKFNPINYLFIFEEEKKEDKE